MELLITCAVLLAIATGILWIFLPFSIFGTKPLIRELIAEQKRTQDILRGMK